ncbi:MAG: hypothetical protein IPP91_18820 [Betaproteobacteria bacterium]|nr:hypothetical protein [Betaproteobacteria bacterium]
MRRLAPLVAALITGCAVAPAAAPPAAVLPAVTVPGTAERLMASLARMLALDELALAAEIARTRDAVERAPGNFSRVEAAMALTMATAPDETQVLALVAPVLAAYPDAEPELRAMAGFLQQLAYDRRKLRDGLASASAKSREGRREAQSQRLRADAQQDRADRLQSKLEALTNLEKSLADRQHADDPDRRTR